MTEQEFRKFIEDQHQKGRSDEDIVKIFAKMFQDGESDRDEFEALIGALGYELSDELKSLSDEDLRKKVIKEKDEGKPAKDETVDEAGGEPKEAEAPKDEPKDEKPEPDEEGEEKKAEPEDEGNGKEDESSSSEDDGDDEDEKKKAMSLFGLKD